MTTSTTAPSRPEWLQTFSAIRTATYAQKVSQCGRTTAAARISGSPPCSVASVLSMNTVDAGVGVLMRWWSEWQCFQRYGTMCWMRWPQYSP